MEKVVVDTSVAIKWFVDEPKSKQDQNILSRHKQKKMLIVVPDIIRLELINGLFFSYNFGLSQLSESLKLLELSGLQSVSLHKIDLNRVSVLMKEFNIASYDALFIALAKELGCPLITNDRKHHKKKMYGKIRYM